MMCLQRVHTSASATDIISLCLALHVFLIISPAKSCLKIRKYSMCIALCVYAVSYVLSGSWGSICILHVGGLLQGLLAREIQLQEC